MSLSTVDAQPARTGARPSHASARIGPNTVIQTLAALQTLEGARTRDRIARLAGLPAAAPRRMIPETAFLDLLTALRRELDDDKTHKVLTLAGEKTGDYVAANRIPAAFRSLLDLLPARLSIPLLLTAFRRHAWTFAGSSRFEFCGEYPGGLLLDNTPTCRLIGAAGPTGGYYEAAFQRLLSLANPNVVVTETECRSTGAPSCRFDIRLTDDESDRRPRG